MNASQAHPLDGPSGDSHEHPARHERIPYHEGARSVATESAARAPFQQRHIERTNGKTDKRSRHGAPGGIARQQD